MTPDVGDLRERVAEALRERALTHYDEGAYIIPWDERTSAMREAWRIDAAAVLAAVAADDGLVEVLRGVLSEHVIECTGCGEVSCRACRDQGWMSWQDYHRHLATHLAAVVRAWLTGQEGM